MQDGLYDCLAAKISHITATGQAATVAFLIIFVWFLAGFHFGFLNAIYQLVINTFTTIVTFQMGFLIQNTQNRDTSHIMAELDLILAQNSRIEQRLAKLGA